MAKKKKKGKSTPPQEVTPVSPPIDITSISTAGTAKQVETEKVPESVVDKQNNTRDEIVLEKPPSNGKGKTPPNGTIIVVSAPWGGEALATIEETYSSPEGQQWVFYKPLEPLPEGWTWSKGVMLLELVKTQSSTA